MLFDGAVVELDGNHQPEGCRHGRCVDRWVPLGRPCVLRGVAGQDRALCPCSWGRPRPDPARGGWSGDAAALPSALHPRLLSTALAFHGCPRVAPARSVAGSGHCQRPVRRLAASDRDVHPACDWPGTACRRACTWARLMSACGPSFVGAWRSAVSRYCRAGRAFVLGHKWPWGLSGRAAGAGATVQVAGRAAVTPNAPGRGWLRSNGTRACGRSGRAVVEVVSRCLAGSVSRVPLKSERYSAPGWGTGP